MSRAPMIAICDACARRTWLLGRLAGHLETARARIGDLLAIDDDALIAAVAGRDEPAVRAQRDALEPQTLAADCARVGMAAVCRCQAAFPAALRALPCPPAVLHVAGPAAALREIEPRSTVAFVGTRRCSAYGRDVAGRLAGECARAGLTIASGLALGIDASAQEAALRAGGRTLAVMPGGADVPYPASHRALHRRVCAHGIAVSELGSGVAPRRWMFPARNRLIAAVSAMTVVVQARERSGALLTAQWAGAIGRCVGAVPGQITSALSAGPHGLLRAGARPVTGAGDVLDALYGADERAAQALRRPSLGAGLDGLLEAIEDGESGEAAFARAGLDADAGLAALAALELSGHVRRTAGGGYQAVAR